MYLLCTLKILPMYHYSNEILFFYKYTESPSPNKETPKNVRPTKSATNNGKKGVAVDCFTLKVAVTIDLEDEQSNACCNTWIGGKHQNMSPRQMRKQ